jgi:hypothetical protein
MDIPVMIHSFLSKKNSDEIRLCVDMRNTNKAITHERHILPTTDELIHDLSGSTGFLNVLHTALSFPTCDNITYYFLENL